jgi:hypothetical protein
MGLLDYLGITAARRPKVPATRKGDKPIKPIGAAGTIEYRGVILPDEYNADLAYPKNIDMWMRMWRSDPAVQEALTHITAPIRNAERTIEPPPNADELEVEITEFVRAAMFDWVDQAPEEFLLQLLSFLPIGHSVFEIVWKVVERELQIEVPLTPEEIDSAAKDTAESIKEKKDAEAEKLNAPPQAAAENSEPPTTEKAGPPDPVDDVPTPELPQKEMRKLPKRQFTVPMKFHQRLPKTIIGWHSDVYGEIDRITQIAPMRIADGGQEYKEVDIPGSHLLVFTYDKWGDEHSGTSILRSAFKPWQLKEIIEKVCAIAYERHGVGIPVAYIPRDKENDTELLDDLEDKLTNLRAGESTFLIFPGPKAVGNTIGYHFEIESPEGGIPDFTNILEHLRGDIKGAMLVRFSELGHAQTGARATSSNQQEVWYAALHALARYIQAQLNVFIRRLVDVNYPDVERYPKFVFRNIEARNLLEYAQGIALMANAEMLVPDEPTRDWVRRSIDAPAEDKDEARLRAETSRQEFALDKGDKAGVFQIEDDPSQTARPRNSKRNP